jgi:putative AdoMet-dependent methyltransferase
MRSRQADYFNHDADAHGYDSAVRDETNPIRAGYRSVLRWVGGQVRPLWRVLDLGSGTGNTILALPSASRVTAVDISEKMTEIARTKVGARQVDFVIADLLEFFDRYDGPLFDAAVSTYALHHLLPEEKLLLFDRVASVLHRGGLFLVGDLMYGDEDARRSYAATHPVTADELADEYPWNIRRISGELERRGWKTSWRRFSELSWGLRATRKGQGPHVPRAAAAGGNQHENGKPSPRGLHTGRLPSATDAPSRGANRAAGGLP